MPTLHDVNTVLDTLRARATTRTLEGMARFGIPSVKAWGVSVADIRQVAKEIGRDHALARSLWASGIYEARMLAAFVDEPERVTVAQMDRWSRDFDNWAVYVRAMRRPAFSLFMFLAVLGCASSAVRPTSASSPVNPFTAPGQAVVLGTGYDVASQVLGETRRVNVLVPPGYAEREQQAMRYSVLYLLDGGADWQDFFHIAGLVHQGNTWGIHQPLIVVGVESKDRKAEFTWPSSDPAEKNDFPTHGNSELFRRFLVEELKPAIDAAFRTNGTDAIMGESLAALFVVETALRDGGHFDHYVAISPSLWWDRGSLSLRAAEFLAKPASNPRTLWLAIADEGGTMQSGMDGLVAALEASRDHGFTWTYNPFPSEKHSTIYHPAATRALRALFPPPPSAEAE